MPTRVSITDEEQIYLSWNEHSKPLRNKGNRVVGQILHDFNHFNNHQGDQMHLQTYFQIFFPKLIPKLIIINK